jgi:signal peptidase I
MASAADLGGTPGGAAGGVPGAPGRPPARRRLGTRARWAISLLVALLLAFGMRAFVFQAYSIPSASMESTLNIGDRILVWKAFFNWHDVRQGDIVVFTHPPLDHCAGPRDTDLVKRVIALGGQTIYSVGNNIYVDGRRLPQPYLPPHDRLGPPIPAATRQTPFHVPRGDLYVMGDNRQISCDSRFWGPIKGTSVVGTAVLLFWHNGDPDLHFF